ncbi:MAG: 30S ribosomal protein S9 [bacterium]|nr:30S ribosomal protein S9 [bacterium]
MTAERYTYALGKRKSARASVRLTKGKGVITVNEKPANVYFADSPMLLSGIDLPFKVVEQEGKYDVSVKVSGGGHSSQIDAIKLGIAKCLAEDENLKGNLRRADLLGRDTREKERKKFGLKGARKQRQFTKR